MAPSSPSKSKSATSAAACASFGQGWRRTTASSLMGCLTRFRDRRFSRKTERFTTPPLPALTSGALHMRLTHFFIERPRFATVLSTFVTLFGLGALTILPVARYPEIVPPTVQVTASYPGASADTVARTVATPLEQEINGVENM